MIRDVFPHTLPNGTQVTWVSYSIADGPSNALISQDMPARSNLHRVLSSLFFKRYDDKRSINIDFNTMKILEHALRRKKNYKCWKIVKQTIETKGKEAGIQALIEQVELLKLGDVISGL